MRNALAARDVSSVYRQLRRVGVSQRQIAAMTGQSQSEVSEILKGRQVMAYDVLARIADGLGVPRGYMGLAYDETTALKLAGGVDEAEQREDEEVKRRQFLQHAAAVTMGAQVLGPDTGQWVATAAQTPTPNRIGLTDVRQIEAATRALRSLDYQYGGGFCRDAVVAQLSWTRQLLEVTSSDVVRSRLFKAVADMHSLAGWTSFDIGLLDSARTHFAKALELAKQGGDNGLVANILYRMGRVYLQNEAPGEALKMFQLGQIAAQESGSALTVAVLCANEAWAYGKLNRQDQVQRMIGRTRDEFERAQSEDVPSWVKFFDVNDLHGMIGSALSALGEFEENRLKYAPLAVNELVKCNEGYESNMQRTHVFGLSMLAENHMRVGDVDQGVKVGNQAMKLGEAIKSKRVVARLKPLQIEASRRKNNSAALDLAERLKVYRTV
ncbi:MAG: helix-turn-helix transcriptional regulator [Kutzneria sp.]|nr:helix-turn-helix transcriptional regulator [Kutzneria sp.]